MRSTVADPTSISEYTYQVEQVQTVDQFPFPRVISITSVFPPGRNPSLGALPSQNKSKARIYDDYPRREIRRRAEIVEARLNLPVSADDFQVTTKIPDGLMVRMLDAPQVRYAWVAGEIVPGSDPKALAAVRKAAFKPAISGWWRLSLVAMNFVILGIVLSLVIWRLRRRADAL